MIETPPSEIVLPTKNMVREAIFSVLGRSILHAVVLDLFAGSGALGLESLSRGAHKVFFSDSHVTPIKIITKNVSLLKEDDNVEIHLCDYNEMIDYLERNNLYINIVFVDPPYTSGYYEAVISRLLTSPIMQKKAKIVIESNSELPNVFYKGHESRHYRYGQTHLLVINK